MHPRGTTVRRALALAALIALGGCKDDLVAGLGPDGHVRFPITAGTPHEQLDCNACHGGFDSFQQFNCHSAGCHAEATIAPAHVAVSGYEYLSSSCYLCHPRGVVGDGVDHTLFFPIQKGQSHQNTSCSYCHVQNGDPSRVSCADGSCHPLDKTDALHPGVLGYDYGASTCLPCHRNGKVGTVDHAQFFPIDKGATHETVPCATCHTEPTDFSQVSCMNGTCHDRATTDDWHATVSGYEYKTASCYGCHPSGQVDFVDHARFFPILPGDAHGGQTCGSCHVSTDRKQVSCVGGPCHERRVTDDTHGAVLGYEYLSSSCLACHKHAADGQVDHGAFFPIGTGDKHVGVACETCHRDPVSRTPVSCLSSSCHPQATNDVFHAGFPDYSYASAACLNCHLGGQRRIDHTYFPTDASSKHANLACDRCHAVPSDRHALNCANNVCHPTASTATQHTNVGGVQWQSAMCMRCHGDGAVPRIADHLPFGITSDYPHFKKACLLCHATVRMDRPALGEFRIRNCFSSGCHIETLVTTLHLVVAPGKYKPIPAVCTQSGCHDNGRKP